MKRVIFLLAVLVMVLSQYANAQNVRWSVSPVVGLYDGAYWLTIMTSANVTGSYSETPGIDAAEFKRNRRIQQMVIPYGNICSNFLKLKSGGEEVDKSKIKFKDIFRNHYFGVSAELWPIRTPFGLIAGFYYERQNYGLQFPNDDCYRYRRNILRPEAILGTRFGSYIESNWNFILETGGAYNHIIRCRGKYDDLNSVKDGVSLIGGLSLLHTASGIKVSVRYHQDCFDYFNKNFTPDGTTYPYKDLKSYHGGLDFIVGMVF